MYDHFKSFFVLKYQSFIAVFSVTENIGNINFDLLGFT